VTVIHTYIHLFKSGNVAHTKTHTKRQTEKTDRQTEYVNGELKRYQQYTVQCLRRTCMPVNKTENTTRFRHY